MLEGDVSRLRSADFGMNSNKDVFTAEDAEDAERTS